MYKQLIYEFPNSIEYEFTYSGNYGAKGEKRAKRKKATPEQIKQQNQRNRERAMRRLIKANFYENDIWCTLLYQKGTRKELSEVKKDMAQFLRRVKSRYKREGEELKFIYRLEIGKRGGIHIHFLCNRIKSTQTDLIIQEAWEHGRVNYENLQGEETFSKLASYIVKPLPEEQLEKLRKDEQQGYSKVSTSRNLIRPAPEKKEYSKRTMRKLVRDGPTPTDGYFIDKDSVEFGTNPYTGMSYYRYTEIRTVKKTRYGP